MTVPRSCVSSDAGRGIAFLLVLVPAVAAADPPPAAPPDPSVDPPIQSVGEVVSTATRTEREVLDIAANVSVLDRKDIDESGVSTLPDLLRHASSSGRNTKNNPYSHVRTGDMRREDPGERTPTGIGCWKHANPATTKFCAPSPVIGAQ